MTPADYNLDPKFTEFRESQIEAIHFTLGSEKRFRMLALPVGSGKSLYAMTIARHFNRTAILTVTKGLQEQYILDDPRLTLIKGRTNYPCDVADNCKLGGHLRCTSQRDESCPYVQKYNGAKAGEHVITNYSYWLNVMNKGQGLGTFDCLILDEAHDADKALSSYLDFNITEGEIERFDLPSPKLCQEDLALWGRWAAHAELKLKTHLSTTRNPHHRALEQERMETLLDRLARLLTLNDRNWVCELSEGSKYGRFWKFNCVWPGQYGEMLFRGIPNVILMSGTLRPKTAGDLGIKRTDVDYRAWPRVFPPNRSPFYHIRTNASLKYPVPPENMRKHIDTMDEFISSRLQRKGIIQTISYDRQKIVLEYSRFRQYMITNSNDPDSEEAAAVIERFRQSKGPSILVSPSFSTGYNFAGFDAEWQWVLCVPFPPMISKVMKRRKEMDPTYQLRQAAKELGQMVGRPMRFEKDRCENATGDDRLAWFVKTAAKFLPEDFAYTSLLKVPEPGPRWNER